ncbi:DNA adenine methylase [Parvimonas micra]|uniref:DNA adenine methylase n=1 Tax=Parvimonas micra TaxID=33033 RepID=UPI000E537128|nr:DNA adenine methylase [Parvimonas micra]AXU10686.1 DNA adenine methylase [Parvimonas micra]
MSEIFDNNAKPFLKWAGGKTQILNEIRKYYIFDSNITKYVEPFIGGGAVLFDILNQYNLEEVYISDINEDLIDTYSCIKNKVKELILILEKMERDFLKLDIESRRSYYLSKRDEFNVIKFSSDDNIIKKSALMIFLNKTCFNGLFRVNKSNKFNVPFGDYKNPKICDTINLVNISKKLKNVDIVCEDYKKSLDIIDNSTFVYIDPPYRPISLTSSFTSYSKDSFDDKDQKELSKFVNKINLIGAKFLLSNSDPRNNNSDDNFFDDLYSNYNINRIFANRSINSKGNLRNKITELLISNF